MLDDRQLLSRYATGRSEGAFSELVARNVNLVYSTALRRLGGNTHLAQDVTQLVFVDLARKAPSLGNGVILAGWLHRATRYAAAKMLRNENRRRAREKEAADLNARSATEAPWEEIQPLLDDALDRLSRADRSAVLLRFFEQRSLAQIGHSLGASEDAARKRLNRALEKLRAHLTRHGLTTSAAALAAAISANAVQVAPAGLAATVTGLSLAGAPPATGITLTLLKWMTMTKIQAGIIGAVVVAGVALPLAMQHQAQARLRQKDAKLEEQEARMAQFAAENSRLSNLVAKAGRVLGGDQSAELLRLRGQVGALRRQTNELAELQEELRQQNQRLREASKAEAAAATAVLVSERAGFARNLAMALVSYAVENQDQFPTNLDQVTRYLPDAWKRTPVPTSNLDGLMKATNQFEIVCHGSYNTLADPGAVIVLRERQAWLTPEGFWAKTYAFADGHSETHTSTNGNFSQMDSRSLDGQ